ncbi:MAG: ABC transporter ATP-binding protein [Limisphaerales bacterium]
MTNGEMIEVSNLTKRYGKTAAIGDLSFTVGRGEVVGLLGPNGAGKTTTMRILTCFMPATSGAARIAGFDVFTQSREVRRCIGYMPENNPLHEDMRVREYLKFRARIKGLSTSKSRERVDRVMEQCGLVEVQKRIIGQLSKGYRQRVGIADAISHEPELIILDEPTLGLDPSQIRALRQLIKELGKQHTLLISTHLLSEVEMTCSRVLILAGGKIRASDTLDNLRKGMNKAGQIIAEIAAPEVALREVWEQNADVQEWDVCAADGDYFRCAITARDETDLRPMIFDLAKQRGWKVRELTQKRHSLEDVYMRLTRPEVEET